MRQNQMEELERALALGVSRREVFRRLIACVGASFLALVLPRLGLGAQAPRVEAAEMPAGVGLPVGQLQINGTTAFPAPLSGPAVNGTNLGSPDSGQAGPIVQVFCDDTYCYTQRQNPTGQPQAWQGVALTLPNAVNGMPVPPLQVNGTGLLPLAAVPPLGASLGSYCDPYFCYTIHTNPSGTSFQVNGTPLSPALPAIGINGSPAFPFPIAPPPASGS